MSEKWGQARVSPAAAEMWTSVPVPTFRDDFLNGIGDMGIWLELNSKSPCPPFP